MLTHNIEKYLTWFNPCTNTLDVLEMLRMREEKKSQLKKIEASSLFLSIGLEGDLDSEKEFGFRIPENVLFNCNDSPLASPKTSTEDLLSYTTDLRIISDSVKTYQEVCRPLSPHEEEDYSSVVFQKIDEECKASQLITSTALPQPIPLTRSSFKFLRMMPRYVIMFKMIVHPVLSTNNK